MAYDPNDPEDKKVFEAALAEANEGLIKKRDELLKANKELKQQIRDGGNDPKHVERLEGRIEELEGLHEKASGELKVLTKERDKLQKSYDAETKFSRDQLVNGGLTDALTSAKIANQFMPAAKALFAGKVEVKVEGDKRSLFVGDKPLGEAVTAWSQSDDGKHFVSAGNNSGGNALGGKGQAQAGKSIARAAFDAMPQSERMAHFADGGTITDG